VGKVSPVKETAREDPVARREEPAAVGQRQADKPQEQADQLQKQADKVGSDTQSARREEPTIVVQERMQQTAAFIQQPAVTAEAEASVQAAAREEREEREELAAWSEGASAVHCSHIPLTLL
jgi:hypothetical protein